MAAIRCSFSTTCPSKRLASDGSKKAKGTNMKNETAAQKDGLLKEYFADGSLSGSAHYKDGKQHGTCTYYYKNGVLKATGRFKDGMFTGYWHWNRENGGPLQHGEFKQGLQVGPWKRY